ncbi:MAG: methyltransferase domain-containing protein, partial [Syntrophales bacterium]|nr:methyltransferase domain-containing protein [Syntrophales bacterium]
CSCCGSKFQIESGTAILDPEIYLCDAYADNKYETSSVVSSYLWSHYSDLLHEENSSDAYRQWADLMKPHTGLCVDAGCAVGRFAFEMTTKCDFVIGVDNARAFIRNARELLINRRTTITLKEEGFITRTVDFALPEEWDSRKAEFIVADALSLPFRADSVSSLASLNLIDKVPLPLQHLQEANRVTRQHKAQFLLSDPYSWSEEVAQERNWLGGQKHGTYASHGQENILNLLTRENGLLQPSWTLETCGRLWWKIRTHANHYEQIRSCYLKAAR